jgi:hypothetical protein
LILTLTYLNFKVWFQIKQKLKNNNHIINYQKVKIMTEKMNQCTPASGAVYGLGLIGSAIYFISTATGFWMGVLGFLKAIVWPIFLVLAAFKSLGV